MSSNNNHPTYKAVEILLPIKTSKSFTYTAPSEVRCGQLVSVLFRGKPLIGVVDKPYSDFYGTAIKEISEIHCYQLTENFLMFLKSVATYNFSETGSILKMALSNFSIKIPKQDKKIDQSEIKQGAIKLSKEQDNALDIILNQAINSTVLLLEGITGSGKTLVYIKAIMTLLVRDGQALLLLPEITLTTQILERLRVLVPTMTFTEWHSGLNVKAKKEIYQRVLTGERLVIVGARSALFLPFHSLKIIVIDEEHDASFKQEEGVIYNARDMAVMRGKIENVPVILVSATPSIETLHNCNTGKYFRIKLHSRYGASILPKIQIVDMNYSNTIKGSFLSNILRDTLKENFFAKKQALLFLNRKGYAPIVVCRKCHFKESCKNCSSNLVFHKGKNRLECHYCGFHSPPKKTCSNCHSDDIAFWGPGVEKIADEAKQFLPDARIVIITSDSTSNRKNIAQLLTQIQNHEIDIIIGTQVISKGLDFKLLQLVGIIDGDCSHTSGDIRAHERMHQLLSQVAGRAGRSIEQGHVIIQTHEPDHRVLENIINADHQAFAEVELYNREIAQTPPFSRLVIINALSIHENKLKEFMYNLLDCKPQIEGVKFLGPSASPIPYIKKRYRQRFIIKAAKTIKIQPLIHQWLSQVKVPAHIMIKIDIDPYSFH